MVRNLQKSSAPKLGNARQSVWISCIYATMWLPTPEMFHVAWKAILHRARTCWGGASLAEYFEKEYLTFKGDLIRVSWHCDVVSTPGFPASQQTSEQWNRKFKDNVLSVQDPENMNHKSVCPALETAISTWSRPVMHDEEAPVSMLAPTNCMSFTSPGSPDKWMTSSQGVPMKPPPGEGRRKGGSTVFVPSIPVILKRRQKHPEFVFTYQTGTEDDLTHFYVMRAGKPAKVEPDVGAMLVSQAACRDVGVLTRLWQQAEVLVEDDKLAVKRLRQLWSHHCMVVIRRNQVQASCWQCRRHGHCVHKYAVKQMHGLESYVAASVPSARRGREALRGEAHQRGSSEEPSPPRKNPRVSQQTHRA